MYRIAAVVALLAATSPAFAQVSDERLHFTISEEGTQASVLSGGRTIPIGRPSEASMRGQMIDLDVDGRRDVLLEELWDDGSTFSIWLRRGDHFVTAGGLGDFGGLPIVRDVEGDGALEILTPGPDGSGVFQEVDAFGSGWLGYFRYDPASGRYLEGRLECVDALRAEYIRVLDEIDATILRNRDDVGSSYGDASFVLSIMHRTRTNIALWRERFVSPCDDAGS